MLDVSPLLVTCIADIFSFPSFFSLIIKFSWMENLNVHSNSQNQSFSWLLISCIDFCFDFGFVLLEQFLCSQSWPETFDPSASASGVLGLHVFATVLDCSLSPFTKLFFDTLSWQDFKVHLEFILWLYVLKYVFFFPLVSQLSYHHCSAACIISQIILYMSVFSLFHWPIYFFICTNIKVFHDSLMLYSGIGWKILLIWIYCV